MLSRVAVIHIATLRVITEVLTKVGGATGIGQEGVGLLVLGRKGWGYWYLAGRGGATGIWQKGGAGREGWGYRYLAERGGATDVWWGGVELQMFGKKGWSYRCLVGRGGATGVW